MSWSSTGKAAGPRRISTVTGVTQSHPPGTIMLAQRLRSADWCRVTSRTPPTRGCSPSRSGTKDFPMRASSSSSTAWASLRRPPRPRRRRHRHARRRHRHPRRRRRRPRLRRPCMGRTTLSSSKRTPHTRATCASMALRSPPTWNTSPGPLVRCGPPGSRSSTAQAPSSTRSWNARRCATRTFLARPRGTTPATTTCSATSSSTGTTRARWCTIRPRRGV